MSERGGPVYHWMITGGQKMWRVATLEDGCGGTLLRRGAPSAYILLRPRRMDEQEAGAAMVVVSGPSHPSSAGPNEEGSKPWAISRVLRSVE